MAPKKAFVDDNIESIMNEQKNYSEISVKNNELVL
jgi:hypothetical protein